MNIKVATKIATKIANHNDRNVKRTIKCIEVMEAVLEGGLHGVRTQLRLHRLLAPHAHAINKGFYEALLEGDIGKLRAWKATSMEIVLDAAVKVAGVAPTEVSASAFN
jgi:hypothetical protein